MITFTVSQLIAGVIAICGCITGMAGALTAITGWVKQAKSPHEEQNNRITSLENRVAKHDDILARDDTRLKNIEAGNRVTQRALLALLSHGINGNNIPEMEKAYNDLHSYLIDGDV